MFRNVQEIERFEITMCYELSAFHQTPYLVVGAKGRTAVVDMVVF